MEDKLNKYRLFLSLPDIQTVMRVLNYHIQSKGESPQDVILYKKLELAKVKIESGILKPEFAQSSKSVSKQAEKLELEILAKTVQTGKASQTEIDRYNMLMFGIEF